MGQGQSKYSVSIISGFLSQWELEKSIGYCELIKNKRSGEQMEKYKLSKQNINIDLELQFYEYRKNQNANLVKVVYIEQPKSTGICTGEDYCNVYCQRIPLRLSELENISFEESLMTIRDSLIGFEVVKDCYEGCLKITDEMIGYTVDGRVKIWINENFYLNHPEQNTLLKGVTYESDPTVTVAQIFHTVQEHLQGKAFPNDFTKKLQSQEIRLDYQKAKAFIKNYCTQNNIILPQKLSMQRYISQFKRQSLKIPLMVTQLKQIPSTRSIKIIPEALTLSPRKEFNKPLISSNSNISSDNLKVSFNYGPYKYNQNYPEHSNLSVKHNINQQSFLKHKQIEAMLRSKHIQRINSQYIYIQQSAIPSSNSRKHLQPFNAVQNSVIKQRCSMLNEDADSLNDRLQKLTMSVQRQIERNNTVSVKSSRVTCRNPQPTLQ